jgi:hypothetical protein
MLFAHGLSAGQMAQCGTTQLGTGAALQLLVATRQEDKQRKLGSSASGEMTARAGLLRLAPKPPGR